MTDRRPPVLEELDALAIGPAPVGEVLQAGRTARRRHRAVLASVAAVAVLITGVSIATAGTGPGPNRPDDVSDARSHLDAQPFPAPPTGTKWVGMNGVVVAVPSGWPVTDSPCGSGAPAEVINGTRSAAVKCVTTSRDARVTLAPLGSGPEPSTAGSCDRTLPSTCYDARLFPDQGISIAVEVAGEGASSQVDQILDSAMVLPDGWTTVPFAWSLTASQRAAALEAVGFEVDRLDDRTGEGPVETSPELGSPVREGSTITLTSADAETSPPQSDDLSVTVEPASEIGDYTTPLLEGSALWLARERELLYIPETVYDSCLTNATASAAGGSTALVLTPPARSTNCADVATRAVLTVTSLTEPPTELTVTENGETRTVDVVDANEPRSGLACPSGEMGGTPGGYLSDLPDGFDTKEQAVEAWLRDSRYEGQDYVLSSDREHAYVLRADGSAEAELGFIVHSGFTVQSVLSCS
jgi:hypothetical protein